MKKTIAVLLFLAPFFIQAQKKPTDSLRYYYGELSKLRKATWDSLLKSPEYVLLRDNIKRLSNKGDNYGAFVIGSEIIHNDYTAFNKSIGDSSFPALNNFAARFTIGMFIKDGHHIFEFNFFNAGFSNKSKKGNEEIKAGLSNVLQMNYGYDLLKSKAVSIYPYAGLSLRMSTLQYKKPADINNAYTNITNIINNDQSSFSTSNRLGYQLGIDIDILLEKNSGTMFYVRAGTDRPFTADSYTIEGVKYKPGIKQADWLVGFGFKFGGPRY